MFIIKEYVPASTIWPNAQDHEDRGPIFGLCRGYNIEVTTRTGETDWTSCCYISENPEEYFDSEFYRYHLSDCRLTPTGRVCFRGYGVERYDPDERDTYIVPVTDINSFKEESCNETE